MGVEVKVTLDTNRLAEIRRGTKGGGGMHTANYLRKVAEDIEYKAKANVHRTNEPHADGSPAFVDTIKAIKLSDLSWKVGSTSPTGMYLEFGTAPHLITPRQAKVLRFKVDGQVIFVPLVHHPGTIRRPWLMPAAQQAQADFADGLIRVWRSYLRV